jgi:hypothetical protein
MKNEPMKEPQKEHFFDHLKRSSPPGSGSKFFSNSKFSGSSVSGGYSGKQIHSRSGGGSSGRQGGKAR